MTTSTIPTAQTPLHAWHVAHGASMAVENGWHIVRAYTTPEREREAARVGLALADISAAAKLGLRGRGVPAFAASLAADAPPLNAGDVALIGAAAPTLACRLTDDHLLLLALNTAPLPLELQGQAITATDVTSAYAGFLAVGPRLEELWPRLTHLGPLAPDHCAETSFAGVEALLVRRQPGLRIYVAWDMAEYVWERIWQAGRDLPMAPLGMDALTALL